MTFEECTILLYSILMIFLAVKNKYTTKNKSYIHSDKIKMVVTNNDLVCLTI